MITLEEALEFVRNSNHDDWNVLISEMNLTRKRRNLAAAEKLAIGDWVAFEPPDPKDALKGHIIRIALGRVTLAYLSQESGSIKRIGVPASMVQRCAEDKQSESEPNAVGIHLEDLVEQTRARNQRQFVRQERSTPTTLGSVSLGATFVWRTVEIFRHFDGRKPPFEGEMMTVVGFKPRYVNQVVVRDPNGHECRLRLCDVERALRTAVQVNTEVQCSRNTSPSAS
jgi:hypothetical protein